MTPGTYQFTATADDGIRVWVDGDLIIDQWYEHAAQTFTGETYLGPGHHLVRVEYFESGGTALAQLTWGGRIQAMAAVVRGGVNILITLLSVARRLSSATRAQSTTVGPVPLRHK